MKVENKKPVVHFTDNHLINPTNPVTVNLIGAGGTGNAMLTSLAKIDHSLRALGGTGLQVNVFDDDVITRANLGRQQWAQAEVGFAKSVILINRVNRFCGTNWKAITEKFTKEQLSSFPEGGRSNIYISCVDTVSARFEIAECLEELTCTHNHWQHNKPLYWMDFGNSRDTGQVILSTLGEIEQPSSKKFTTVAVLPKITDEFKDLLNSQKDDNEPSCSHAESLGRQNLFINSTLANEGGALLWDLFFEGMTECRGFFMNLKRHKTEAIPVG